MQRLQRVVSAISAAFLLLTGMPVFAAPVTSRDVPCEVGVGYLQIEVTPASLDYGFLAFSGSGSQAILATNSGTNTGVFQLWGTDADVASKATWALGATPALDVFKLTASKAGMDTMVLTKAAQAIKASGVNKQYTEGQTQSVDIALGMPTDSTYLPTGSETVLWTLHVAIAAP